MSTTQKELREQVFERDGHVCRICTAVQMFSGLWPLELAHLQARGMGGNPDDSRNTTANCLCACQFHHQGPRSLHSGHLRWMFLSDLGADGPMEFRWSERLPKADLSSRYGLRPRYETETESA